MELIISPTILVISQWLILKETNPVIFFLGHMNGILEGNIMLVAIVILSKKMKVIPILIPIIPQRLF
ncbi:hypothetical protein LJPFL01_3007 [Lelliottia jeotgali]|nr:hypothetical protein LJPFL01_3007 [Lelliottia jeotgali]